MVSTHKNKKIDQAFTFHTRAEYYEQLASMISQSVKGDRIAVATMSFKPNEPPIQRILQEMRAAAKRGVKVILLVDAFPFIISDKVLPGPLWFRRDMPKRLSGSFRKSMEPLNELMEANVEVAIINRPARAYTNPFASRSHIKFAVINDYVYIGGCNLTQVNHLDLMVGLIDSKMANWLVDFASAINRTKSVTEVLGRQDKRLRINSTNTLLIDVGMVNQSLILEKALSLIDAAQKDILITCQYFPNGITAHHLDMARKRGVKVTIIYNYPGRYPFPLSTMHHGALTYEKLMRHKTLFTGQLPINHDFLHAKLLITDQGTMLGSHNYVPAGVKFGTAEIALLSRDVTFGRQAKIALMKQLTI